MQKTRNRTDASTHNARPNRFAMQVPEQVDIDTLGTMLDEDLIVRLRTLEDERGKAYEAHQDSRPWEEEIAYVRREQQLRRVRRDNHMDYLRRSEGSYNDSEAGLPAGDFDNSAFVYAATGGRPRWN